MARITLNTLLATPDFQVTRLDTGNPQTYTSAIISTGYRTCTWQMCCQSAWLEPILIAEHRYGLEW